MIFYTVFFSMSVEEEIILIKQSFQIKNKRNKHEL